MSHTCPQPDSCTAANREATRSPGRREQAVLAARADDLKIKSSRQYYQRNRSKLREVPNKVVNTYAFI